MWYCTLFMSIFHIGVLLKQGVTDEIFVASNSKSFKLNLTKMKKSAVTFIIAIMALSISSFAGTGKNETGSRTWTATADYKVISISNDINVVLVQDASNTITIEGEKDALEFVKLEVSKGVLRISSKRPVKDKVMVSVPVQQLQKLIVSGASQIFSMGIIKSEHLDLRIEGACKVNIRTTGTINVENDDQHDYEVVRSRSVQIIRG